ncbi:MAG: CHAT domain-containing protein [Pirellulaceae bacterium]|nr:CHAT domain-containing protein [Pirellulaceae bacterium]
MNARSAGTAVLARYMPLVGMLAAAFWSAAARADERIALTADVTVQDGKLDANAPIDPRLERPGYSRRYTVRFEQGKFYLIDLHSYAFDSCLRLEDAGGDKLQAADGGGKDTDARMLFQCAETAEYQLVSASEGTGDGGPFELRIQRFETAEAAREAVRVENQMIVAWNRKVRDIRDLNQRVIGLWERGELDAALPLSQRAARDSAELLPPAHPEAFDSATVLAVVYANLGRIDEGIPFAERALELAAHAGKQHSRYAMALNNLAYLHQQAGAYDKALPLFQQSHALQQAAGKLDSAYASSINNLAYIHWLMGRHEQAEPLYLRTLEVYEKLGERSPNYAITLNNLANLYRELGRYDQSLPMMRRALNESRRFGESHPARAISLNDLGTIHAELGELEQAAEFLREAVQVRAELGKRTPEYAKSAANLSMVYREMGRLDDAISLAGEAAAIFEELGLRNIEYAFSLLNLSAAHFGGKDYERALDVARKAQPLLARLDERGMYHALLLNNMALCHARLDQPRRALELLTEASTLSASLGDHHPRNALVLFNMAANHYELGEYEQAVERAERSLRAEREVLDRTFSVLSSRQRRSQLVWRRLNLDLYFSCAVAAGRPASEIYQQALSWKGVEFARIAEESAARDQPQLAPLIDQLRRERSRLARLYFGARPGEESLAGDGGRLKDVERRLVELEQQLAEASQPFRGLRQLQAATPSRVADALPPGAAFVDYQFYDHYQDDNQAAETSSERRLLAFVFSEPGSAPALLQLGSAEPIEDLVTRWREAATASGDPRELQQLGRQLRQHIWQPLADHVRGSDTVFVAPDGVLCQLPLAALPDDAGRGFLVEQTAIGYFVSGQHLLAAHTLTPAGEGTGLLTVGDLDYGQGALARLPGTRSESERVAQLFRRSERNDSARIEELNGAADKPLFLKAILPSEDRKPWKYVHVATHGRFEESSPAAVAAGGTNGALNSAPSGRELLFVDESLLRCSLALAGANTNPSEGLLSGKEIASLDLRGVDLVVLSACETGLGKIQRGEGVLGLQQAFQRAGAQTLIASLWSVDDAATSLLMEHFFRNLWQGRMSKLEALRQAQLTIIRQPELVAERRRELRSELAQRGIQIGKSIRLPDAEEPAPPAVWAAFVLSGAGN